MKHTFRLVRLLIAPLLIGLLIWGAFPAAADSTLPQPPVQAAATLIYSNNTAVPVANDSCGNSIINVPDTGTITDVDVYMDVSTQWGVGDFTVALISPATTNVLVFNREFGPPDNMQITLDDESGNVMGFQNPPSNMVTGTYQPSNSLSGFDAEDSAGNWTLRLCDGNFADPSNGTINGWTITITTASNATLAATATCDVGNPDNLVVDITTGDGPFQITSLDNTPSEPIVVPTTGTYTLQGPDRWRNLEVIEQGGDLENLVITADIYCANLNGSIIIPAGAPGTTSGPASPYPATLNISGLGASITDINVNILGLGHTHPDDVELLLVSPAGTTALLMNDSCTSWGGSVFDFTFDDEAAGQLISSNGCTSGSYRPTSYGPTALTPPAPALPYGATLSVFDGENPNGTWLLYVYDESIIRDYGDIESWSLDITAPTLPLTVNSSCNAGSLEIAINDGDAPFTIDWSRDGVPQTTINAPSTGTYPLMGDTAGPDIFNVTVTEVGGDGQTVAGLYSCSVPVDTTVACAADGGLDITINAGDLPFALTYVLNGIPIPPSLGYPLGLLHLGPALDGPSAFTNIQLEELTGDLEDAGIADTSCNVPLNTTFACNGDNLDVTINNGDGPFNITGTGNGLPANSVGVGTTTLTGPAAWLGVTVTEGEGDGQSQLLGDIACSAGTPGLVINATDNQSGEDGSTATIEVSLATPPLADVTVAYSSSDTSEGTITGSPLLFTSTNWMTPQLVTVAGVDDFVQDGDIAYTIDFGPTTSADGTYNGLTGQATITNLDNDTAGIGWAAINPFEVDEEGPTSTNFFVSLNTQPTAAVSIDVSNSDGQCTVLPAVLNFDDTNWNQFQEVIVTAVDDAVVEGNHACDIDLLSASADPLYDVLTETLTFAVFDNDAPEIILTPAAFFTWEEGEPVSTYTVELGASPAVGETVTVDIEIVALQLVSQAPIQVTFDDTNWNVAVEIDVQPLDDGIDEGVTVEIITHTATSDLLGSPWEGVTADLELTIFDTQALAFPPEFDIPNTGEIMISLAQTQQPYDGAGGEPIYLPSGAPLLLPHDFDGNGFDTYTVTETQTVAGETWYGIFIGNATWVWVPADGVTVLR